MPPSPVHRSIPTLLMATHPATPPSQTPESATMNSAELPTPAGDDLMPTGRHAKKLSLNFPILPPLQSQQRVGLRTSSPTRSPTCSPRRTPRHEASAPRAMTTVHSTSHAKSGPTRDSTSEEDPDTDSVLTLVAAQERRVLELREELHKAESELQSLKRQWAVGEARKKSAEVRSHTHRMKRLSAGTPALPRPLSQEDDGTRKERQLERRKSAIDRSNIGGTRHAPRRSQQRIFSSSRHTRALSLLATSAPIQSRKARRTSFDDTAYPSPSPDQCRSCAPSTDQNSSVAVVDGEVGFGRTYKKLAIKKTMGPVPPAADVFMRQGQKVAEGLKEGLWNLFEDIRQATVGEEGINGVAPQQTMHPPPRPRSGRNQSKRHIPQNEQYSGGRETSFWSEFGIDTPRKANMTTRDTPMATEEANRDSAATLAGGTDLLVDLNDDDEWEPWESPTAEHEDTATKVHSIPSPKAGQPMPWPELKRPGSTDMKLTKSMSALMQDWDEDSGGNGEQSIRSDSHGHQDDSHALASQHV